MTPNAGTHSSPEMAGPADPISVAQGQQPSRQQVCGNAVPQVLLVTEPGDDAGVSCGDEQEPNEVRLVGILEREGDLLNVDGTPLTRPTTYTTGLPGESNLNSLLRNIVETATATDELLDLLAPLVRALSQQFLGLRGHGLPVPRSTNSVPAEIALLQVVAGSLSTTYIVVEGEDADNGNDAYKVAGASLSPATVVVYVACIIFTANHPVRPFAIHRLPQPTHPWQLELPDRHHVTIPRHAGDIMSTRHAERGRPRSHQAGQPRQALHLCHKLAAILDAG
ncbi:hypothetical protein LZ32DRAFT_656373 [Colletotrichum eremochloae]|nr:hypothetical protein LZ32DRAFT_656373 [Colletotrichum eremochloae]